MYLHDEFSTAGHSSLWKQHIFGLLLLFGLLNLSQSANRVHALSVFWSCLREKLRMKKKMRMRMRDTDKAAKGQMDGWLMFTSVTLSGEWQKGEWACVNEWLTEWASEWVRQWTSVWIKRLQKCLEFQPEWTKNRSPKKNDSVMINPSSVVQKTGSTSISIKKKFNEYDVNFTVCHKKN